jgi:hypothetical protein
MIFFLGNLNSRSLLLSRACRSTSPIKKGRNRWKEGTLPKNMEGQGSSDIDKEDVAKRTWKARAQVILIRKTLPKKYRWGEIKMMRTAVALWESRGVSLQCCPPTLAVIFV